MGLYDELEGFDWRRASEVGSRRPLCSTALLQQGQDWFVASQTSSRPGACVMSMVVHCLLELCPGQQPPARAKSLETSILKSCCLP